MKKQLFKIFTICSLLFSGISLAQPAWTAEICLVTVDSSTASYISVICNKTTATDIDTFYIFRSDSAPWVWNLVGRVAYEDSSVFDDIAVDVNNKWYKYKISATDLNGIEGARSVAVNSCWLDVIPFVGSGYYTCQWNVYDNTVNPAFSQRCMWDSLGGGSVATQVGGTMPPNWTSWNHSGYSLAASSQYRLEVELSNSCSPSRAIINTSRSNVKGVANPSLQIQTKEDAEKLVNVYPNPAGETLQLQWNGLMGVDKIELTGIRGELVFVHIPLKEELKKTIALSGIASGVYFVRFHSAKGVITKKFLKEE